MSTLHFEIEEDHLFIGFNEQIVGSILLDNIFNVRKEECCIFVDRLYDTLEIRISDVPADWKEAVQQVLQDAVDWIKTNAIARRNVSSA